MNTVIARSITLCSIQVGLEVSKRYYIRDTGLDTARLVLELGLKGTLGLRRDARQVAPRPVIPVHQCRVLSDAVVPHDDGAGLPLDTNVEVGAPGDVLIKKLEKAVRLLLLKALDFAGN